MDRSAALQCGVGLAPGESIGIVAFLGQCASADEARALVERYRQADPDAVLREVTEHWDRALGSVQVKTPDLSLISIFEPTRLRRN
ncbi:hypothetical protein OEZ72_26870 [Leclercia adecarboxylata]|nr:hypothetical protein [Leclercia adecarboxylata]MDC6695406.1 hypothetical protein [Leclercia adecarboxylata]